MDNFKNFVADFLIDSFVEDYSFNKQFIDHLNIKMQKLSIPYEYTYDEFCIELLDRSTNVVESVDISTDKSVDELCEMFRVFMLYTVKDMETTKIVSYCNSIRETA